MALPLKGGLGWASLLGCEHAYSRVGRLSLQNCVN